MCTCDGVSGGTTTTKAPPKTTKKPTKKTTKKPKKTTKKPKKVTKKPKGGKSGCRPNKRFDGVPGYASWCRSHCSKCGTERFARFCVCDSEPSGRPFKPKPKKPKTTRKPKTKKPLRCQPKRNGAVARSICKGHCHHCKVSVVVRQYCYC